MTTLLTKALFFARDVQSRLLFQKLRVYSRGHVLDVGGWDFFKTAVKKQVPFEQWTNLEIPSERISTIQDPRYRLVLGDGCKMPFQDSEFETVLNVQVLEHVFEPIKMVEEIARVLKPGGHAIFLIPQTGTLHMAPFHYYNFTRYWSLMALQRTNLELVELVPLGGAWSTMASRLVYFFLQSWNASGRVVLGEKRPLMFYVLWPFMAVFAVFAIPLCLLFALGDLREEANNHLVVARKPKAKTSS